jgi:hypothetical protein
MKSTRWSGVQAQRLVVASTVKFFPHLDEGEKRKRLKLEQMEDSVGNGVNVMNGRSEVGTASRERRGEAASNQGRKQAISKQASKQSGVNEQSWREDEERLLSVACAALSLNHLVNWKS